jgi:hypothetical protein
MGYFCSMLAVNYHFFGPGSTTGIGFTCVALLCVPMLDAAYYKMAGKAAFLLMIG